jgi:hypothetical protein
MRVLIACEYSGKVREAFRKLGHDAWSCDLLPSDDNSPYHIQGDVLDILNDGWDMMIAHPPCTYLSNAGAKHLYRGKVLNQERYAKGLKAKAFFMALYNANIPMIAIENPVSSLIFCMPPHTQYIQPYQFGVPLQKKTRLWLKNLPPLESTNIVKPLENTRLAGNWFNKTGNVPRWKARSETFKEVADAMAAQWSNVTSQTNLNESEM